MNSELQLGLNCIERGDMAGAEEQLVPLRDRQENDEARARARNGIGMIRLRTGKIDEALTTLKGFAIGGAMVSRKHSNFIVNTGTATSADIEALIEHVQKTVKERCGVLLEREVRIIGERQ